MEKQRLDREYEKNKHDETVKRLTKVYGMTPSKEQLDEWKNNAWIEKRDIEFVEQKREEKCISKNNEYSKRSLTHHSIRNW
jgi:hypothetical protein